MNDFSQIYLKMQKLPQDWNPTHTPQIFEQTPGLGDRLALATGRFFIAAGKKLVHLAAEQPQLGKKAA